MSKIKALDLADNQAFQSLVNVAANVQRLTEPFQPLSQSMTRASQAIAPFLEAVAPLIEHQVRYNKFIDAVGPTGWLPYHTLSIDYVEELENDVSLLEVCLAEFYETNWDNIRQDIESRLNFYCISEESKETFREALSAHSVGHYRCVCRVLFPQIEKEFRIHFFEDSAGHITSREILNQLNSLELKSFLPREAYGWILLDRLVDHLYEKVDGDNRTQYEDDFVPNRHASAHGLVSYSTFKHSMNMIVMSDYIFQVLTSMVKLKSPNNSDRSSR